MASGSHVCAPKKTVQPKQLDVLSRGLSPTINSQSLGVMPAVPEREAAAQAAPSTDLTRVKLFASSTAGDSAITQALAGLSGRDAPLPSADIARAPAAAVPLLQRCAGMTQPCPCQEHQEGGVLPPVQRHAPQASSPGAGVPTVVADVLRSPGSALPARVRSWLESGLDTSGAADGITPAAAPSQRKSVVSQPADASEQQADAFANQIVSATRRHTAAPEAAARRGRTFDLSRVRVHTDALADRAARAVSASAYTVGHDIVFAAGAFAPQTMAGQALLAHEIGHVIQQEKNPSLRGVVHRKPCRHDGEPTGCYAAPSLGKVTLTDVAGAASVFDIGDLVVADMHKRFGGTWLTRVQVPPTSGKGATRFGYVDGLKVRVGSTLDAEIVEVKARSEAGGGCTLADTEAQGYRTELDAIKQDFIAVSASLAAAGGLRIVTDNSPKNKAQALLLASAGATGTNPQRWYAWTFYNTLQNKLNTTFTSPFTALNVSVNADGDPAQTYQAAGPWTIVCKRRGKSVPGVTFLNYQVSGKGGASYGCDKQCQDEEEERRKRDQPGVRPEQRESTRRLKQEGEEPEVREPHPPAGQPGERRDVPPQPQPTGPGVRTPGAEPGADPTYIPELLAAAAALAAAAKRASVSQAERAALEAAYKRTMTQLAEAGAKETAERLAINGVKLGSKALEEAFEKDAANVLEKDLARMSEQQLQRLAVKEGEKLAEKGATQLARRTAGKALAKAIPYLGILLIAKDALAMADHVSKGGSIEFGLTGSEADLSGSTDVTAKGAPKGGAGTEAKLSDTKIDVETSGVPDVSGATEINADKVTVTGSVRGDGTPVTVNFKARLQNSTITIKHAGVLRGGKVVLSGDVTVKDSQIEIDLPPGAQAASSGGAPVVISGAKLKVTTTGAPGGGGGGTGQQPPVPATPPTAPAKEQAPPDALKSLSPGTRAKVEAAGREVQELIAAMLAPGKGGVKADDAATEAILKKLADEHVTPKEIEQLKGRIGGPAKSLDELLARLDENIKQVRAPATTPGPPGAPPGAPGTAPPSTAPPSTAPPSPGTAPSSGPQAQPAPYKPPDPKLPIFQRLGPRGIYIDHKSDPHSGADIQHVPAYGKLADGQIYTAWVSIHVVSWSGKTGVVQITSSSQLNTLKGPVPPDPIVGHKFTVSR